MSPGQRIGSMLIIIPLGLATCGIAQGGGLQGGLWGLLLPLLGATIGPYMALTFPFELVTRVALAIGLVIAPLMVTLGWRNRTVLSGQIATASGIALWTSCGLLGLSTGT